MNPFWFKRHVAYTVAKYNMSMFALGLAAELGEFGIAVNTIWPKTGNHMEADLSLFLHCVAFDWLAIDTEAINLIAGDDYRRKCRKPEIMADAVYTILTQDSKSCTGNFFVDEHLLRKHGVTDFDQYSVTPGSKDLMLDFFLDENMAELQRMQSPMGKQETESKTEAASSNTDDVAPVFTKIQSMFTPELLKKVDSVYLFDLQGKWRFHPLQTPTAVCFSRRKVVFGYEERSRKCWPRWTAFGQSTMYDENGEKGFPRDVRREIKTHGRFHGWKIENSRSVASFLVHPMFFIDLLTGDLPTAMKLEKLLNQMVKAKQ